MKVKKLLALLLAIVMITMFIAACADNDDPTPAPVETDTGTETPAVTDDNTDDSDTEAPVVADDLPFVNLTFYMVGEPTAEWNGIQDVINSRLEEDINANLEMLWLSWGEREMRYPLILASGEPIDLILTGTWLQFNMEASNGSFLDITDLAPVYMPNYYAEFSANPIAVAMASPGGGLYGIPTPNVHWDPMGFIIRGDIADEVGFDGPIDSISDYVDFMRLVAEYRPDLWTGDWSASTNDGLFPMWVREAGYNYFPAWPPIMMDVRGGGEIIPALEAEGALDFFLMARDLMNEGIWSVNVLNEPAGNRLIEGASASRHHNVSSWASTYIQFPEWEPRFYWTTPYTVRHRPMQDATALPASSPNPERALMMLDLFHMDESYFRLIAYGIEGVHYEIDGGQLRALMPDVHAPTFGPCMAFRRQEWLIPLIGSPANLAEVRAATEAIGYHTSYSNFLPYFDNVLSERAAVMAVWHEQIGPLAYGLVDDVEGAFNRLREDLDAAGLPAILAEVERQFEIFRAEFN